MISFSSSWADGIRRGLPIILGYLPVGFAFGILAVKNGIPPSLAIAMAICMFSGSGQFVFASLWGAGAGIISTAIAVAIINLRYFIMSAAELPWLANCTRFQRFLLGLGLTDETFIVHAAALESGWKLNITTMYVCNSITHISWITGCAIGSYCGTLINDSKKLGLDYALPAMFIALLLPQCKSGLHLIIAIFTICTSIFFKIIGMNEWNIAISTILGATLALVLSQKKEASKKNDS